MSYPWPLCKRFFRLSAQEGLEIPIGVFEKEIGGHLCENTLVPVFFMTCAEDRPLRLPEELVFALSAKALYKGRAARI